MGNREIKTSNKTKEEIVEGLSLRVTTPSRAREPVLEVETDLAGSGVQSGSVSNSTIPTGDFVNSELPFFSKSKSQGQCFSTLM